MSAALQISASLLPREPEQTLGKKILPSSAFHFSSLLSLLTLNVKILQALALLLYSETCVDQGSDRNAIWFVQGKYAGSNLLLPSPGQNSLTLPAAIVEQFVTAPLPRTPGLPLVDDWDCLRVSSPLIPRL